VDIARNISVVNETIPSEVKLVAVSKTKSTDDIMVAYLAGQKAFGENKIQELVQKYEALPKDIEWHFIGHPQTNKVKFIAPFISLIHSVDSLKLLKVINAEAAKNNRKIDCLLQFHIATETTKFGFNMNEALEMLESAEFKSFKNVTVCGVMGMATFTDDLDIVRAEFSMMKAIFETLRSRYFKAVDSFRVISMGMSDDYKIAIEEGSTLVRIGSKIFGERNY